MKIIVSDTGPINYLVAIDAIALLPKILDKIIIPQTVFDELCAPNSPTKVKNWVKRLPKWCEVQKFKIPANFNKFGIDAGEMEAIAAAAKLKTPLLLDDADARKISASLKIKTIGTLGIIKLMVDKKLISLEIAIKKLEKTNFYFTPKLLKQVFAQQ